MLSWSYKIPPFFEIPSRIQSKHTYVCNVSRFLWDLVSVYVVQRNAKNSRKGGFVEKRNNSSAIAYLIRDSRNKLYSSANWPVTYASCGCYAYPRRQHIRRPGTLSNMVRADPERTATGNMHNDALTANDVLGKRELGWLIIVHQSMHMKMSVGLKYAPAPVSSAGNFC